jgi:dihydroorotate dehydrogenase (fumarate)
MINLRTKYLGMELRNPLIVGSSGLTDSLEKLTEHEKNGAGAVILRSLFEEEIILEMEEAQHQMTGRFIVYPETFDYMDQEEEKEDSVRKYLRLIKEAKEKLSIPVIASINCVSAQKWIYFSKEIEKAGADALELNLFILPSDFNRNTQENEQIYFDVIEEVKKHTSLPVALKISFYHANLGPFIQKLSESGIQGLVLFNRFYSPDFDLDDLSITSGHVLSAPEEIALPLRWISIMADRVQCDLSASTGIHSAEALIKQLLAGADTVQLASVLYKKGPEYLKTIISDLQSWMEKHEYTSLADFRGTLSQAKSKDPAAFERVQFMKHFRHFIKT